MKLLASAISGALGLRARVYGLGLGFGVWGSGFRGLRFRGLGFRARA